MSKHTPGPWRVGDNAMGDPQTVWAAQVGICIGTFFDNRYGEGAPPRKQADANAHLVAAAPDLLEALVEVMAALRIHAPGTALNNHRFDALGIKAYAAINKAEGLASTEEQGRRDSDGNNKSPKARREG